MSLYLNKIKEKCRFSGHTPELWPQKLLWGRALQSVYLLPRGLWSILENQHWLFEEFWKKSPWHKNKDFSEKPSFCGDLEGDTDLSHLQNENQGAGYNFGFIYYNKIINKGGFIYASSGMGCIGWMWASNRAGQRTVHEKQNPLARASLQL